MPIFFSNQYLLKTQLTLQYRKNSQEGGPLSPLVFFSITAAAQQLVSTFIWILSFDLSGMGGSIKSKCSHQHCSQCN